MKDISANKYVLPSIQREYVWYTAHVRKLYLNLIDIAKDGTNKYDFGFMICDTVKNSAGEYGFEVGKILEMDDLRDVAAYVIDNISFSEKFNRLHRCLW